MTSNQIAYANYRENVRHNKQTERLGRENVNVAEAQVGLGYANLGEMYRHNYSTEQLTGQQTEVKQQEAETNAYNAETKRIQTWANILPDWAVAIGYGINEVMESATGDAINRASEKVAKQVHSNPNRKHRKR